MHFNIDTNNKIIRFHIERLEESILGEKLTKKINLYNGKKFEEFLKFALKERLFLKVPILNVYGKKTLTLWAIAAREGKAGIDNMIKTVSSFDLKNFVFAEIRLNVKGTTLVLLETNLSVAYRKLGFLPQVIELHMPLKDAKAIAIDFNIARNSRNMIRVLVPGRGYAEMELKGIMFVGSGLDGFVILNKKEITSLPQNKLSNFASISFTNPSTDEEKEEVENIVKDIIKKINLDKAQNENMEKKPEKKGFFSRLLGGNTKNEP
jgi:hypothetical protein